MKHKLLFCLLFTFAFSSCKILRPTRIKTDAEYMGIEKLSCSDPSEKNCTETKGQKYILIHGIGSQHDAYSEKMIKRLSKYSFKKSKYQRKVYCLVGEEFVEIPGKNLKTEVKDKSPNGQIRVLKIVDLSETKTNTYYSINWSVLTAGKKDTLRREEFKDGPRFIGINKGILKKVVMVEKVSDAFNGSEPETISMLLKTILLVLLDDNLYKEENLNLISGSFGSQLFLGAMKTFQNLNLATNAQVFNNLTIRNLDFLIPKNQRLNMFLLTNQINLMDENIDSWFMNNSVDSTKIKPLNYKEIQIVAFRNPNDILCYYLPKKVADKLFEKYVKPEKIKVYNAYYFNWPIRNDVGLAHTCVFNLKKLAKAVYYGTDAWGVKIKRTKH